MCQCACFSSLTHKCLHKYFVYEFSQLFAVAFCRSVSAWVSRKPTSGWWLTRVKPNPANRKCNDMIDLIKCVSEMKYKLNPFSSKIQIYRNVFPIFTRGNFVFPMILPLFSVSDNLSITERKIISNQKNFWSSILGVFLLLLAFLYFPVVIQKRIWNWIGMVPNFNFLTASDKLGKSQSSGKRKIHVGKRKKIQ